MPMQSLRKIVRECTREAHDALEATAVMRRFADGLFSVSQYRHYLSLQLRLHAPLESALTPWVTGDLVELRLCKAAWLKADLHMLGESVNHAPAEVQAISSTAEALGVLYVLEGGTLGLQVVRKRLEAHHPALRGADRFLRGYGADTGRHWQAFVMTLDTLPEPEWAPAIASACATFSAFQTLFAAAPDEASP